MLHDLTLCFLVTWPDFVLPVLILPISLCCMTWPYVSLLSDLTQYVLTWYDVSLCCLTLCDLMTQYVLTLRFLILPDLVRPELTYCFLNWSYVAWPGLFVWYFDDVPLVEFIYTLYLHACQVSYHGRLRSLLLCLCDVFQALINSLVCWFGYFVCLQVMQFLISRGADMNRRPSNGNGLLHMAAAGGSEQCCRMLWKRGFDINEQNSDGNTPLSCAVHTKQVGIDG